MACIKPTFGITKLPTGQQKAKTGGAELHHERLLRNIESQGVRLAWSRASVCPCSPPHDQTNAPDPLCDMCDGGGVYYFGPKDYSPPEEAGVLTEIHDEILARDGAAVIRGVIQRVTQAQDFYDVLGNWVRGTMAVTVRPENKIGYYDRLVNFDSEVPYSELVEQGSDTTVAIRLRYLATDVTTVRSESTRYEQGNDFCVEKGRIKWKPGKAPSVGTRLSVHYLMHPTWLVIDHPHVLRGIQRRRKIKVKTTPIGTPVQLPIQASVRLEFLPSRNA